MRTISLRLDDATDAALKAHCQRYGMTQTDAIKAAIEHLAAAHRPTPAELAAEVGLIGGFRSGISDLARNRGHYIRESLNARRARDSVPTVEPKQSGALPSTKKPRRSRVPA
jgi:hypothetical protein